MDNNRSKFTRFETLSLLFLLLFCLFCFSAHIVDAISAKMGQEIFSPQIAELLINLSWISFLGLFAWAFCLAMSKMQNPK